MIFCVCGCIGCNALSYNLRGEMDIRRLSLSIIHQFCFRESVPVPVGLMKGNSFILLPGRLVPQSFRQGREKPRCGSYRQGMRVFFRVILRLPF